MDVRGGDLAHQRGPREVPDLTQVVRHVPHGRDAAVDEAAQDRFGGRAIGRSGEVLVRVDQAGRDEVTGEVDDFGAVGEGGRHVRLGRDGPDHGAVHDERHGGPGRAAGPVEQREAAVDHQLAGPGRREGFAAPEPASVAPGLPFATSAPAFAAPELSFVKVTTLDLLRSG